MATAATIAETEREMTAAIRLRLEGLREDGIPPPLAETVAEYIEA